jgi:transposase-like protein
MVCRKTRKVIFSVAKTLTARLIRHKIRKHCQGQVIIYTDEFTIYHGLKNMLKVKSHNTVKHSDYIYAVEDTHVNNCENRHSLLRPALNIFRGVSKRYLELYVKFIQFKLNNGPKWFPTALKIVLKN